MDAPSHYDYRRQGPFQDSNPGYPLHVAEGSADEPSRGPDEGRPVHRHAYSEERPERGSTSVDSGYPSEPLQSYSAWPRQRAQTDEDDGEYSARGDEYSVAGMYGRGLSARLPRRIAAAAVTTTDSCSRGANSMTGPLYNGQDLEQCLHTNYHHPYDHPPSQPQSAPIYHDPSQSSSAASPMSLYYESPTRHYGPGLTSTASASIVGGHFHVSSPSSHVPHLRSPVLPLVETRAEYTTSAGAPRLPSAGLPSPWSSGSTTDSFYAGFQTPEAPSAPFNPHHRHSSISSQSSPQVTLNSPPHSYPATSPHMAHSSSYSPTMSPYSQYNQAGHSQIYTGRSHVDTPSISGIQRTQAHSSRYYLDHHGQHMDFHVANLDVLNSLGGPSVSPSLSPFHHGATVSLNGSTPSASDLSSAGDSPKLQQKIPTIKRRPTQLRPDALVQQPRLQTLLQELLDAPWLKDAAFPERTITQGEADLGFGQVGETIFRAFLKPFQVETPGEGRHTVWRCLLCPAGTCKDFQRIDRAEDHIRHQFDYRKFVCGGLCGQKKCKKPFLTKVSLNAHIEHHRSPEYVQCEHCHQTLLKRNLKRHHTTHCGKLRATRK